MDDETTGLKLLEPEAPEALVPETLLQPWMIGVLIVILGIWIGIWLSRKGRAARPDPSLIRNAAYREAVASLDAIRTDDSRDAAVQSSLVLRKYLAQAVADPALYETHEEFLARHESLADLTETAKLAASEGFSRLAAIKYAPESPSQASSETVTESRSLLDTIHHGFPA